VTVAVVVAPAAENENKISSLASSMDRILFPLTSRRASVAISGVMVALLTLLIFSVRQNILTYDNTLETVYFVLTVAIAWGAGSWLLLGYVGRATTVTAAAAGHGVRRGAFVSALHIAVVMTQFSLLAVMLFVVFDRSSEYLMSYVNGITSGFAVLILAAFAFKLLKWYRKNNRKLIILVYFFTAASLATMVASDLYVKSLITYRVSESAPGETSREAFLYKRSSEGELVKQDIEPDHTVSYFVPAASLPAWTFLNNYPGLVSRLLLWGAMSYTLYLYNRERHRMNSVLFWVLVSLPIIIYLLGRSPELFGVTPEPWTRPLFRGGNSAMAVLFGIAFLVMAKKVPAVKDYLTVTSIGIMVITIAFGITNMQQTFGVAGHSLVLLSSYMFAIGLYYCAVSVSHDAALRKEIHLSARGSPAAADMVESAGVAEMYDQLEQRVLKISRQQSARLVSETGVRPSLEEGDIKQYLDRVVLPEILKEKDRKGVAEA
jgi:hypothetical protein